MKQSCTTSQESLEGPVKLSVWYDFGQGDENLAEIYTEEFNSQSFDELVKKVSPKNASRANLADLRLEEDLLSKNILADGNGWRMHGYKGVGVLVVTGDISTEEAYDEFAESVRSLYGNR